MNVALILFVFVAKCIARFWNTLRSNADTIALNVARSDLEQMIKFKNKACWSWKVCTFLDRLGLLDARHAAFLRGGSVSARDYQSTFGYFWQLRLDADDVATKLRDFWRERVLHAVGEDPRTCASYPIFCSYAVYTGVPASLHYPDHMKCCMSPVKHKCFMRFRLCSWFCLEVHADHSKPRAARRPRHLRTCRHCACGTIEDERHVLFECTLYNAIRQRYASVFTHDIMSTGDTKLILNHANTKDLVDAIYAMYQARSSLA